MVEEEKDIVERLRRPHEGATMLENEAADEIEALRFKYEASQAAFSEYMSAATDEIERLRGIVDSVKKLGAALGKAGVGLYLEKNTREE